MDSDTDVENVREERRKDRETESETEEENVREERKMNREQSEKDVDYVREETRMDREMESEPVVENGREAVPTERDTENIRKAMPGVNNLGKIQGKVDTKNISEVMSKEIDIKEVRKAALAQYEDLTKEQKQAARKFFDAMDEDKNGSISVDEFMSFLSQAGFQTDDHEQLFEELDKDNNGTLSFEELVTFFHILSRDDYKHLLKRNPSTDDVPRRKGRVSGRRVAANGQGRKWNMGEFFGLYNKLKGVYRIGQRVKESECNIL